MNTTGERVTYWLSVILLLALAVAGLLCLSPRVREMLPLGLDTGAVLLAIQTCAVAVTGVFVFTYVVETRRQTRLLQEEAVEAKAARLFETFTTIADRLQNAKSLNNRRLLCKYFEGALSSAVQRAGILTLTDMEEVKIDNARYFRVDVDKVLEKVKKDTNKLDKLNEALLQDITKGDPPPLDVVEQVLADFDVLAVPARAGVKQVMCAAEAWKTVILRTAPIILPFVALQMQLGDDPGYKVEYRYLLERLGYSLPDSMRANCAK